MFVGRVLPCQPNSTPPVAGSRPSNLRLWMTPSAAAASATVRPWGPTVSCVFEMGTTPARLVSPTVGLMAATPLALAGQTMLPSVSLPNDTAAKFDDAAAPEPELEPQGLRSMPYGLCVCPPRPDQPLIDSKERKFAHSERLVLPKITAPPARRLAATVESRDAGVPTSAKDPALVCILSPVSMLSLSRTGMPCKGPSTTPRLRSASALRAMTSASGFSSITAFTPGPFWSSATIRAMYSMVSTSEVSMPEAISAWSSATVASLCRVGMAFCVPLCPDAEAGASRAARSKIRITGVFMLFPPGSLGRGMVAKSGCGRSAFRSDQNNPLTARSQSGLLLSALPICRGTSSASARAPEYTFAAKPPRNGGEFAAAADFELERFLIFWFNLFRHYVRETNILSHPVRLPCLARSSSRQIPGAIRRLLQKKFREAQHHVARVRRRGPLLRLDRRRSKEHR